jgi:hypothetical protein
MYAHAHAAVQVMRCRGRSDAFIMLAQVQWRRKLLTEAHARCCRYVSDLDGLPEIVSRHFLDIHSQTQLMAFVVSLFPYKHNSVVRMSAGSLEF